MRIPPAQSDASDSRSLTIPRSVVMRAAPTETGISRGGVRDVTYSGTTQLIRITGNSQTPGSGFDVGEYTADAEL